MSTPSKQLNRILLLACSLLAVSATAFASIQQSKTAGTKGPFVIQNGDASLTIGGKAKVEHYFQPNMTMLNNLVPDQNEFFKETVDVNFDIAYGKQKYGHNATELYLNFRHKGVFGKAVSYANKDAGPVGPNSIRLSESIFGKHSHVSGKPLIWYTDAWLSLSLNAAFGIESENVHTIKAGWFPFDMGRGIALGSVYGVNKEGLGLYSYSEDKGAPGILLHGDIVKDKLAYDLYMARFEERSNNFGDSFAMVKRHWVDKVKSGQIWRGTNKDDSLYAGRLKWQALKDHRTFGSLQLEPYAFYNAAFDQVVDIAPDADTKWGSYGLAVEHSWKNLEIGGEVAFNYGEQNVFNIDKNGPEIKRNADGFLVEQYTHVLGAPGKPFNGVNVPVTTASTAAVKTLVLDQTNAPIPGVTNYQSKVGRFRPAYKNTFHGWMGIVDMAYTIKAANLKLAAAYSFASGDVNPNQKYENKKYNGFIGLHEWFEGSRVKSVLVLGERNTTRPSSLAAGTVNPRASQDLAFSDLQTFGVSATWTPKCFIKDLSINPNMIGFWKSHQSYKFIATPDHPTDYGNASSTEVARSYMGTELNLCTRFSAVKDCTIFAKAALFAPGGFYTDMKGVPLSDDALREIEDDPRSNDTFGNDGLAFRVGTSTAYHLNIGIELKF
jgi:hypothetical protein